MFAWFALVLSVLTSFLLPFLLTNAFGVEMLASAGTLSTQDAGQAGALFELLEETRSAAEVRLLWVPPLTSLSLIA